MLAWSKRRFTTSHFFRAMSSSALFMAAKPTLGTGCRPHTHSHTACEGSELSRKVLPLIMMIPTSEINPPIYLNIQKDLKEKAHGGAACTCPGPSRPSMSHKAHTRGLELSHQAHLGRQLLTASRTLAHVALPGRSRKPRPSHPNLIQRSSEHLRDPVEALEPI